MFAAPHNLRAQWEILSSGTTADLRGIANVGQGIAWASGSQGTVLRTTNDGKDWQRCTTPPDADKLDFRGIQAFDAKTAIVMSSGKGPLSRLYITTDGCQSWTLVFTNPDPEGFWDAISSIGTKLSVLGDPVSGHFTVFTVDMYDASVIHPKPWYGNTTSPPQLQMHDPPADSKPNRDAVRLHLPLQLEVNPKPLPDEAFFAASNSAYVDTSQSSYAFVSGGPQGARAFFYNCSLYRATVVHCGWVVNRLPLNHSSSAGAFSIATNRRTQKTILSRGSSVFVAVGGDYSKSDNVAGTAAYTSDNGRSWAAALTTPHGYRSAVAYDAATKAWITVGPNGTDVSTDDGRNWRALKPSASEPPDADQHWNALSLPFVVGPHGRIGKLRPGALKPVKP